MLMEKHCHNNSNDDIFILMFCDRHCFNLSHNVVAIGNGIVMLEIIEEQLKTDEGGDSSCANALWWHREIGGMDGAKN